MAQGDTVKFKFSPQFDSQSILEFADQFLENFTFVYDLKTFSSSYKLANVSGQRYSKNILYIMINLL